MSIPSYESFWQNFQADNTIDFDDIKSGLPYIPFHSCQYFVKGTPAPCTNWDGETGKCTYNTAVSTPTGYRGNGACDYLGRREWCDKYEAVEAYEDRYLCIAPCMDRSGLGKKNAEGEFEAIPTANIRGYNGGFCDRIGLGRGGAASAEWEGGDALSQALKLPQVCNYYRPYSMGFGFTEPQQVIKLPNGSIDLETMRKEADNALRKRLPHQFKL